VLISAHALSRAVLAYPLLAFSPVHADGLGATVGKPTDNDVWITIGIGAGLAFLLMLGKGLLVALLAPLAVLASAWFTSHWVAKRLGGYTGDTLGAVQQKAEVVFLVVAALFIGS
jgi:adenosylcobinamide-GDP ribazoletransferase